MLVCSSAILCLGGKIGQVFGALGFFVSFVTGLICLTKKVDI
jgi:Ca2+/Na+ antiporter